MKRIVPYILTHSGLLAFASLKWSGKEAENTQDIKIICQEKINRPEIWSDELGHIYKTDAICCFLRLTDRLELNKLIFQATN